MTTRNLDALFTPKAIAVIGASNQPGSVGAVLARNLLESGFAGPVMAVNPHDTAVRSTLSYKSLADLPLAPDLAVIATPPATVPGLVAELGARGCRAVLLKGGHLEGQVADALSGPDGDDLFLDERLPGNMRGTGCVLAFALAAELARGLPLIHAVQSARSFVRSKIARQMTFGGINVAY